MLIKLSAGNRIALDAFAKLIGVAADRAGCFCIVAWSKPQRQEIRFILVDDLHSREPATFEQHDHVIASLLMIDREATIRTSKHTYNGWADFSAQFMDAIPGERNDAAIKTDPDAS